MNVNATIIGQMITFWILIWFVMKYVWTPLSAMMDARQKRIAEGLSAGDRARHELELANKRSSEILHEAKGKGVEIVGVAEKRGSEIIEEAKKNARVEAERIIAGAHAQVEQEVFRAKEALRQSVAELAVAGAEKILRREINKDAHAEILNKLQEELK
jgi:F-type H+-transporting ATPase subunit b